jgi:predicted transposase YdaD
LKTDSIFYRIFQTDPGILFELLGRSSELAQNYEFSSVEIKQVAFRIDGVLLPKPHSPDKTVWFIEVQFQEDQAFYLVILLSSEAALMSEVQLMKA